MPLSACSGSASSSSSSGSPNAKFTVVAAENFWGSIATQLAGDRANVQSIIVNPNTDPHDYQATAQDSRTIAGAQLAIVNGIGYDEWMSKAVAANPVSGRVVLDIGHVLGLGDGDNPHQWYSPASVGKVVDAIVADYVKLDPGDAAYFKAQKAKFKRTDLAEYNRMRREIRTRYAGVPVGYSESVFAPLGADLHLKLLTPYGFAKAIAEGTEVTPQDKQTVDEQVRRHEIKVWVYNRQNATPDIQRINEMARAEGIPVATFTETLSPASDSFEQWQVTELKGLMAALHRATAR